MVEPRQPLWRWPRRVLNWLCGGRADYREFQRRKATRTHRAGRTVCLWVWAGAAGLMALCGGPGCVLILLMAATFLSFALLDET